MFDLELRGKVAVVTGGSRGIGRAICLRLAEAGVSVVVNYLRGEQAASEVVEELKRQGGEGFAFRADVSRPSDSESLVAATMERYGRLDILVCNAGIWEGAPVEEMDEDLWDRVLKVNLKGTWAVCRAAVPLMKRLKSGRIVIVSSTAGQRGEAGYSNYAASKGGQISFTKSLSTELAPFGINVNAVAPGWVETELNEGVFGDADYRRQIEDSIPLKRIATPDDIAYPVVFLCSHWARHITGEILNVNGGSVLCG